MKYALEKQVFLTVVGGTATVGSKNCYLFHDGKKTIMVDCGLGLEKQNGEDIKTYPPFKTHLSILKNIHSIFISHGHLDHVGALTELDIFLWRNKIDNPRLLSGEFTLDIANKNSQWDRGKHLHFPVTTFYFDKAQKIQTPFYTVQTVPTPHSITDGYGFLIDFNGRRMYYAGDFRLNALDEDRVALFKQIIERIGQAGGVDYAFIESTNVDETDEDSEWEAVKGIEKIISRTEGRIIFSTFSTHTERASYVARIAQKYGRPVYVAGNNVEFCFERKGIRAKNMNHDIESNAFIFATGCQAEKDSAIMRALHQDWRSEFRFLADDTIILSSDPIPANGIEEEVFKMVKKLLSTAGNVWINVDAPDWFPKEAKREKIHSSGHGKRQDLEWMINMLRPRIVIPVHADFARRQALAHIARKKGMGVLLLEEGQTVPL